MFARITTFLLLLTLTSVASAQIGKNLRRGLPASHNLPPAQMLLEPGKGVGGPGPGVLSAAAYASTVAPPIDNSAAIAAAYGPFSSTLHPVSYTHLTLPTKA